MDKQETFQAVYKAFRDHELGHSDLNDLKKDLTQKLQAVNEYDLCHAKLKNYIIQCINDYL